MIQRFFSVLACVVMLSAVSCSSDDDGPPTSNLTLEIIGLESLTNGANYEGWIVVDGVFKSTGKFSQVTNPQVFAVNKESLDKATSFVLSIEPPNDSSAEPSQTRLLSGTFNGSVANVDIKSVVTDFNAISGKFVMATPTDNVSDNDQFGIWFEDPSGIVVAPGLNLPKLADGWKYEGWVIFNGTPVTTGTFKEVDTFDDASPYSGNGSAPSYPGEDFLNSAPQGLTFPDDGDVRGKEVVISIEPSPDYDQATPFFVKPLKGMAEQLTAPSVNTMEATNDAPFGRVRRD